MKLSSVEFSPDRVVIDRKWEWTRIKGRCPHYHMPARVNGMYHLKTPEEMAQYCRDLLSDPTRRGFIKKDTLNIVRRTPKKIPASLVAVVLVSEEIIAQNFPFSSNITSRDHSGG